MFTHDLCFFVYLALFLIYYILAMNLDNWMPKKGKDKMIKTKKYFVLMLIGIWIILTVSCSPSSETSASEPAAEQTLQVIYAEFTAQAVDVASDAKEVVPTEVPTQVPTQVPQQPTKAPLMMPGEPPEPERTLKDSNSSFKAYENRAISGDNFLDGVYERPFTSREMVYQPDLDIITVDFATDEDFFYFTINLYNGPKPDDLGQTGMYGVEFDRTKTGRGDLIVWVENPQHDWSVENVSVYTDNNGDVGGPRPIIANAGFEGNGYDTLVELKSDKVAFARHSPNNANAVQIAVSRNLLENPPEFLWGAWADNGLKNVSMFDYNDTMGPTEAGSPIKSSEDYPLDALYSLDNTCRLPYGFEQIGAFIRGMCITQPPAPNPAEKCDLVCIVKEMDGSGEYTGGCHEWACK
jgi:hypothetical protein